MYFGHPSSQRGLARFEACLRDSSQQLEEQGHVERGWRRPAVKRDAPGTLPEHPSDKWGEPVRQAELGVASSMLPVVDLDIYRESKDASLAAAEARKVRRPPPRRVHALGAQDPGGCRPADPRPDRTDRRSADRVWRARRARLEGIGTGERAIPRRDGRLFRPVARGPRTRPATGSALSR